MKIDRRTFLQIGAGSLLTSALHSCGSKPQNQPESTQTSQSNATAKIAIGYWPIAAGLPLYLALEKGYFKELGLEVEGVKFTSAQQVAEAIVAGRIQGCANGVGSGNLALSEIASPGVFKIIAGNPSNAQHILDEVIVAKNSPIKKLEDLKGKRVACVSSIHSLILVKTILEQLGIKNPQVLQLPIEQHVSAIESGKVDAIYTFEPIGTMGKLAGVTRVLEAGVISRHILGDPMAPWFGGSAVLRTSFINAEPEKAKKYIDGYRRAIETIRKNPDEALPYLAGYTSIEGNLAKAVPLTAYTLYDEFTASDIKYFQRYFDLFYEKRAFARPVEVAPLIFKGT